MEDSAKVVFNLQMFQSDRAIKLVRAEGFESLLKHSHEFIELVYVESGSARHVLDGISQTVQTGDLFVIRLGQEHHYIPKYNDEGKTEFELTNFLIPPDTYSELLDKFPVSTQVNVAGDRRMQKLLELLREAFGEEGEESEQAVYHLMYVFLLYFLTGCRDRAVFIKRKDPESLVEEICAYLKKNSAEKITLDGLAKRFFCSKNKLIQIFRRQTGVTIYQHILKLRIEKACELLITTDLANEEIAKKVGFEDFRNFYRYFKSIAGCSPKQYRQMATNK